MARKVKPETRAKRLVEMVPENKRDQAYQLAMNLIFMEEKLDETRERIKGEPTAVFYDNGGGQTGTRVNPEYQAYESLLKSYCSALRQFHELSPAGEAKKSDVQEFKGKQNFKL